MEASRRLGRDVRVATVTLAELYRGAARSHSIDALLAREGEALRLRDTDRSLARLVGTLLYDAGAGSELLADAHSVAVTLEAGGGVVLTTDPDDLRRLAAPYRNVIVETLG
jgi:predicted nucleic acid-binding protein